MIKISCKYSERQLTNMLRTLFFPHGRVHCTKCGYRRIYKLKNDGRYHCRRCRKKFSLFSHTWLRHIRIPLTTFMIVLWCWMKEYSIVQTQDLTGLSVPSIRRYFRLFRIHIVKSVAFEPRESVQVDEAYFGSFKKQSNVYHSQKTYHLKPKVCVAGISCPSLGILALRVIQGKPGIPVKEFIREKVPRNVTVYSDGSPIYTGLRTSHYHVSQTHDQGFATAAYIEGCWSWTKRRLFKQYHHMTAKYAPEYVAELEWRFNTRKLPKDPLTALRNSLWLFH
jgi:transposase-like protein